MKTWMSSHSELVVIRISQVVKSSSGRNPTHSANVVLYILRSPRTKYSFSDTLFLLHSSIPSPFPPANAAHKSLSPGNFIIGPFETIELSGIPSLITTLEDKRK